MIIHIVLGGIGMLGTEPASDAMNEADTLLMIGTSFPYIEYLPKPGQAKGIQIDIKPENWIEISCRNRPSRRCKNNVISITSFINNRNNENHYNSNKANTKSKIFSYKIRIFAIKAKCYEKME